MSRVLEVKVVFLGDASVGKTSLIAQYNFQAFDHEIDPTVGSAFILKTVETTVGTAALQIWDTAGQEKYRGLTPMYTRNAMVAVLVFDVTSDVSWKSRDYWTSIIHDDCPADCRVYCVANKADLEPVVSIVAIEQWALENNFAFFKTSAKDYESVALLFDRIGNDAMTASGVIYDIKKSPQRAREGSCC